MAIPAYDEPGLLDSLRSLYNCRLPNGAAVEVIVLINEPEDAPEEVVAVLEDGVFYSLHFDPLNPHTFAASTGNVRLLKQT